jgi:predicted enzyme related to lactoylglutathione lyase
MGLSPAGRNVVPMSNDTTTNDTTTTTSSDTATMTPRPVTWFEIHSADPARAKEFHGSVLGWTFDDDSMPGYTMIRLGDGAPIGGGLVDTGGAYPSDAVLMVQVPDVAAAIEAARAAGGSVIAEAQTMPNGLGFGYVANPDGAVLGVWCPPG